MIVTRNVAIPFLSNLTVAGITGSIRGLPTEVTVGEQHGLERDSVVNCDNLFTLRKSEFGPRRGDIDALTMRSVDAALRIALELD